ncbi:hypothetical protein L7F22_012153 [Adiantum nelumboides]|nr:hypothetical protein [Adiantum nelumboides]
MCFQQIPYWLQQPLEMRMRQEKGLAPAACSSWQWSTGGTKGRYLNDVNYFGGFEQDDLDQLFEAMQSNFKAWVSGFVPLAVGDDMDSFAVQEFSRTLFSVRPDIAFGVAKVIFESDFRGILPYVTIPCHILQSNKDLAVPVVVSADYLHQALGAKSIVEILQTEGHLPQLSSPNVVVPALRRHLLLEL